jgi:hypothetical protein
LQESSTTNCLSSSLWPSLFYRSFWWHSQDLHSVFTLTTDWPLSSG